MNNLILSQNFVKLNNNQKNKRPSGDGLFALAPNAG